MMRYLLILFVWSAFQISTVNAQTGTAYGIKGGMTAGTQSWNDAQREYLVAYNGSLFMESVHDSMSLRFFGEVGYTKKGSAIVSNAFFNPITQTNHPRRVFKQPFEQVNLIVGFKNMHSLNQTIKGYYGAGARLDYLIRYDLLYLNVDQWVNKLTYGFTFKGGVEYQAEIDSPVAFQLEASFHQDLSNQIFYENAILTDRNTNQQFTQSARVINSAVDVTLGIKFIRRIIWVDALDDSFLPSGKYYTKR